MAESHPNPDPVPGPGAGLASESPAAPTGAAVVPGAALDSASGTAVHPAALAPERTWTVVIAALGGEGGGVLSNWLVDAASVDGRRVQATSVPGVAQRTGATTYYLEIGPRHGGDGGGNGGYGPPPDSDGGHIPDSPEAAAGALADPSVDAPVQGAGSDSHPDSHSGSGSGGPVMALLPTPGNVDLLVASELLEAGRAAQNGMITPDRTTVIASTHRMFAIAEKSAMGDGRFNDERVRRAVRELSRRHVLTDLGKVAERAGTVLSSVLLGAVAGSEALPIPRDRLRSAIERAGIAVEANLRGFDAGCRLFDEATAAGPDPDSRSDADPESDRAAPDAAPEAVSARGLPAPLAARVESLPEPVREFARMGVERTVDYQDVRYGAVYLDRIERLLARTAPAGAIPEGARSAGEGAASEDSEPASPTPDRDRAQARVRAARDPVRTGAGQAHAAPPAAANPEGGGHAVGREAARQLALWMCFEDIIRVADLKTRRARIERVRAEVGAKPGQPVAITEFLKPGVDEWCSVLPDWLARPILRAADRGGWRRRLNVGLHVRTSSVTGFLLLWTLARLKGLRRGMHRYREEQARIETWLGHVGEAHAASPALALEVAKCANLVKGYGDTHERGVRNFERTMACLDDCAAAPDPAASLRTLREAALADPEGGKFDAAMAALGAGGAPRPPPHATQNAFSRS